MPTGYLLEESLQKPTSKKPKRRKKKSQPPVPPPKPTASPPEIDAEGFTLVTTSRKTQPKVMLAGINNPPPLPPAPRNGRQGADKSTDASQMQEMEDGRRDAVETAWRRENRWEIRASSSSPPCRFPERDAPRKIVVRLPPTMGKRAPPAEEARLEDRGDERGYSLDAGRGT
ncbi:MAG: hypothetical protein LQ346_008738 [Caloplaca aetnensis]|nr:MAG: hypothetical protein LQ346_008738 [Caloplaca aetnensis]